MSLHNNPTSASSTAAIVMGGFGLAAALSLAVLQTDVCSRRLLNAEQLREKRHKEYQYQWTKALLQRAAFLWRQGGNSAETTTHLLQTQFLYKDEDLDLLVNDIVSGKKNLSIARIGTDNDNDNNKFSKELYVWLVNAGDDDDADDHDDSTTTRYYRLPLVAFGLLLAHAFENQVTTTTFCFVCDASGNAATRLMMDLVVQATKLTSTTSSSQDQVHVVSDPLWMVCLAALIQTRVVSRSHMERLLFAFCRLEALSSNKCSTLLLTLPQAVTPLLLPILQAVFPDDRHVFAYSGCVAAVTQTLLERKRRRASTPSSLSLQQQQASMMTPAPAQQFIDPVAITTPLSLSLHKSSNVMAPFDKALAALPLTQASVVETWMAAVDSFLTLKESVKEAYLPYVWKLEYLTTPTPIERGSDAYWSLRSLLQYVTGSRSREVPPETMDAAMSWLMDHHASYYFNPSSSSVNKKAIENAVFQHKLILIENKTLKDTVQPAEHWTLKAATKRGCACCLPEEDDDDDDDEQQEVAGGGLFMPTTTARSNESAFSGMPTSSKPSKNRGNYVDGKTTFAFDPTRFS